MSLDPTLKKFNATDFQKIHQELVAIDKEVDAYQAQKRKTNTLAVVFFATFVLFFFKLAWNKFSGIDFTVAASSSFSVILALFDLALGVKTLWSIMGANTPAQRLARESLTQRISNLIQKSTRKFYREITRLHKDPFTSPEVLDSMQSNLRPYIPETTPLITDYILIGTQEFTLEGDSAENFTYSSKINDNLKVVEASIGEWRKNYSKKYNDEPESRNSAIMQVYASQCIQNLPTLTIVDGQSSYTCHSPTTLDPKSGQYIHTHQNNQAETGSEPPRLTETPKNTSLMTRVVSPIINTIWKKKESVETCLNEPPPQNTSPTVKILSPIVIKEDHY